MAWRSRFRMTGSGEPAYAEPVSEWNRYGAFGAGLGRLLGMNIEPMVQPPEEPPAPPAIEPGPQLALRSAPEMVEGLPKMPGAPELEEPKWNQLEQLPPPPKTAAEEMMGQWWRLRDRRPATQADVDEATKAALKAQMDQQMETIKATGRQTTEGIKQTGMTARSTAGITSKEKLSGQQITVALKRLEAQDRHWKAQEENESASIDQRATAAQERNRVLRDIAELNAAAKSEDVETKEAGAGARSGAKLEESVRHHKALEATAIDRLALQASNAEFNAAFKTWKAQVEADKAAAEIDDKARVAWDQQQDNVLQQATAFAKYQDKLAPDDRSFLERLTGARPAPWQVKVGEAVGKIGAPPPAKALPAPTRPAPVFTMRAPGKQALSVEDQKKLDELEALRRWKASKGKR